MKKRKLRPSIKYGLFALLGILIISLIISFLPHKFDDVVSKNPEAQKLIKDNCLVFYPESMDKYAKEVMKLQCDSENEEDQIFDYDLKKYGKYTYINYGDVDYLLDDKFSIPAIGEIKDENALMIISDYLRYTMKSNRLDYAYSLDFLEQSYYQNLNVSDFVTSIKGDDLHLRFDQYDIDFDIPLIYIGKYIGIDLNTDDKYIKPTFVDPERPIVCLTFDDGPKSGVSNLIIDELYKYDANASFYVVGTRLSSDVNSILEKSIRNGNEYGSHTNTHPNLRKLSKEAMLEEVNGPVNYFKTNFDYDITTYRPPFGAYNDEVDQTIPYAAILWSIDTKDWDVLDAQMVYDSVFENLGRRNIVIMHDIYESTANAIIEQGLVKQLVSDGYQLVTIDEYAKVNDITLGQGTHLCWD